MFYNQQMPYIKLGYSKFCLLIFFLLASVFSWGQADLVRWNGANDGFGPAYLASNFSASNITIHGSGSSLTNNGQWNQFFKSGGSNWWPSGGVLDPTKYVQFTITPNANYQINLDQITFDLQTDNGAANFEVRYSKNPDFSQGYSSFSGTISGSWATKSGSLSSVNPVLSNQTVYIRLYIFNTWNALMIRHSWGGTIGPTITGTVSAASPPVAVNDNAQTAENIPVTINILGNDTHSTLNSINITQQPTNGQNITVNGTTNVTYTPNNGYTGADSFKYTITDGNGTSNEATVTLNVIPVAAPTAVPDAVSAFMNQVKVIKVLANDTQGSGAFDEIDIVSGPANGDLVINPDLTISYTPDNNYTGADSFTYNVTNIHNATSNNATVNINVTNPVGLVRWNNVDMSPSLLEDHVNSLSISSGGITLVHNNWEDQIFHASGWTSSGTLDETKYVEFSITSPANYTIDLDALKFYYKDQGGSSKFQVRISKDDFAHSETVLSETTATTTWTQATVNLSAANPVLPNETVKIRIYVYGSSNPFQIKRIANINSPTDYSQTPTITGVVSPYITGDPADLGITLSMDPEEPNTNDEVTITIEVENFGPNDATNVIVNSQLPTGFTYVSDNTGGDYNPGTGVWEIGDLEDENTATLIITVEKEAVGPYTFSASVSHGGADSNSNNNAGSVTPSNACSECTHSFSGSGSINVLAGQIYCLHSGTFTGSFNIQEGGTICIAEGAEFLPSGPADPTDFEGTIINRGTMVFPLYSDDGPHTGTIVNYGTYNTAQIQGFAGAIENHGTFINSGGMNFLTGANMTNSGDFTASTFQNFPGELTNHGSFTVTGTYAFLFGSQINNFDTATFEVAGTLNGVVENNGTMAFGPLTQVNGVLNNYITMRFHGDVDIYTNTYITNDNLLEFLDITDDINFQGPMLTNNGLLRVTGPDGSLGMNSYLSQMHNNGTIIATGSIFHNVAGSKIVNNCTIECETYVVGNGTSENNGLILTTGTTNSFQINGGPSYLINGSGAHIQGSDFVNSGRISGYGTFYFTGYTNNQNEFGADSFKGDDPDNPILFYDESQTGPIFDATNGQSNVIRPPILEGYITVYEDYSDYECSAPPSTAGYPPVTRPIEFYFCEVPESLSFDLDNDGSPTPYAQPHPPVDDNPFTLMLSSITLFDPNDPDNPASNNTTNLNIPGKGTLTVNTSTGVIDFTPDPAFTNGDVLEAEYRIWNQWSGTPPIHPGARTPIVITINGLADIETEDGTTFCLGETLELTNPDADGVWSSEDEDIATVDEDGLVTSVSGGTTKIFYTKYFEDGDCSLEKEISITINDLADIETEDNTSFCSGGTIELSNPDAGGIWSTEDEDIATVDSNGVVTGIAGGTTHIIYTMQFEEGDCELTKEIEITVEDCGYCGYEPEGPEGDGVSSITGISTLENQPDGWPENIPNGYIVLQSKSKGFVITRVASPDAITNPEEGMVVYSMDDSCVMFYNGTVWKCLGNEPKCPD